MFAVVIIAIAVIYLMAMTRRSDETVRDHYRTQAYGPGWKKYRRIYVGPYKRRR